ncbi:HAD family hydrolase [Paucilactobacillus suebicus]|uniref:HAD superfamily hydrolase n=1 Tax=Paucilactobacillus suebicus DSM 5007 = KCTC 3549 TaxID=1423807 RepID=A0A0R1WFE0_9LACO|nr:HAD family hydrolase [Paucilactobacillus suebicus]KRM12748.1 HAD superfamily hydrolase [Paucilactobacillus suebicus DSM 5007 = KCTC 3549]
MTIKLVAVDMDGTFLRDDNTYDGERFKSQLSKMVERGIHFVAASGSQLSRLQDQFGEMKDKIDFISENGSIVYSENQFLSVKEIPNDLLMQLLKIIKEHFQMPVASTTVTGKSGAYMDESEPQEIFELKNRYYAKLSRIPEILNYTEGKFKDQIVKVGLSFASSDNFDSQVQLLRSLLPKKLASLNSGFNTELIGLADVDKSTGLRNLQNKYGVKNDEIMTFGDNENDLAMLTMTPHGYVMDNAKDSIKKLVNKTAPSNNKDGVLTVLDRLLS